MKSTTVPVPNEAALSDFVLIEGTDDELHDLFELLAMRATPAGERRRRRQLVESPTCPGEVAA